MCTRQLIQKLLVTSSCWLYNVASFLLAVIGFTQVSNIYTLATKLEDFSISRSIQR